MDTTPIWHKPAWITAIVGLVSVFLTIPELVGNYYSKNQDIKIAEAKTEALRLGNLESKQDQEFKIVNTTLSKLGTERVFVLRYLAATLDDPEAKVWAADEVTRLDSLASEQESLDKSRAQLLLKEKALKEKVISGAKNTEALKSELVKLRDELEAKKSEISETRQKAGISTPRPIQAMMLIHITKNPEYDGRVTFLSVEIEGNPSTCAIERGHCQVLVPIDAPPEIIVIRLSTFPASLSTELSGFGSLSVTFFKESIFSKLLGHTTFRDKSISYKCNKSPDRITCTQS